MQLQLQFPRIGNRFNKAVRGAVELIVFVEFKSIETKYSEAVTFNPDGNEIASAGNGGVATWDPRTGKQFLDLRSNQYGRDVAYSPDGTHLVYGGQIWQTNQQGQVRMSRIDQFRPTGEFVSS